MILKDVRRTRRVQPSENFFEQSKPLRDPLEIRVSHMTPIVERDLADAAVSERADRCEKFAFRFEIGEGGAEDAAQTALSAQTALHVEQIGFDPLGPRFVEAGLDDSRGFRERP